MSVNPVSSAGSPYAQPVQPSPYKQARQDFAALSQALSSGDLSGARQSYAAYQQDLQALQPASGTQSVSPAGASGQNSVQGALSSLGQALSSGNLEAAQSAFANLQQDMQAARSGQSGQTHHHHHHHGGGSAPAVQAQSAAGGATSTGSAGSVDTIA